MSDIMTVEVYGVEFSVDYEYTPAEVDITYYSDGSGYHGASASVRVNEIYFDEVEFTGFFQELGLIEKVEDLIFDRL